MKITRDVINDLWPLYLDGAVSADSRARILGDLAEMWAGTAFSGRVLPVVAVRQSARMDSFYGFFR